MCFATCSLVIRLYGRNQKGERFVIVLRTVLQYFVVKLQCVLCKITNATTVNYKLAGTCTHLDGFCWSARSWPACHHSHAGIKSPLSCTVHIYSATLVLTMLQIFDIKENNLYNMLLVYYCTCILSQVRR